MSEKYLFLLIAFCVTVSVKAADDGCPSVGRRLWGDFLHFSKNVFTPPTIKIAAIFVPFYTIARIFDKPLHKRFYCYKHHRNKWQAPNAVYYAAEGVVGASIASLMSLSVLGHDGQRKRTAQLYTVTLPLLWLLKTAIKQIPFKGGLRPPNGCFRRCKYYGGFPSGHMFEMTYSAAVFGKLGPKFGIPLGILTGFVGLEFINCNRHYLSQLVAGAAFGLIFASAANRALAQPDPRWSCLCVHDGEGPAARVTYSF